MSKVSFIVETLHNKEIPIELTTDDTIMNVKETLEGEVGVPPVQLKLILNGKPVDDNKKIGETDIKNGTKLHLVFAMRA